MAVGTLAPAFIEVDYSSQFAPHVMTIPINEWLPPDPSGAGGYALDWNDNPVNVDDVMDLLLAALAELFYSATNFNGYTVWTKADSDAPNVFGTHVSKSVTGLAGATTGVEKAVQTTYTITDTLGHLFKLVLLDAPPITFNRTVGLSALSADEQAVIALLTDEDNFFRSRQNGRPASFRARTATLNEALRRQYHMA
jgi:hypothetical protein